MAVARLASRSISRRICRNSTLSLVSKSAVRSNSLLLANALEGTACGFGFPTALRRSFLNARNQNPENGELDTPEKILEECARLYDSIAVLNEKLGGTAIPPATDRGTSLPFVLLVGNHSSGKSSFINYLLKKNIQTAGVAPTDDSFTVIAPGAKDKDSDGPTLIGDPDLGFASLRQFGPTLIHHTQLKVRQSHLKFMLVDSPGMIDAPASVTNKSENNMDRGYDFPGVVRWLARRADIVLLFFDPDKPGTTGETMSVLLNSLTGMDHKLLIVLNKADQFHKIHDFARAYGSLCWNLSKVIPRKDLPPIFTMSLPNNESEKTTLSSSLSDLEHTRDDVVEQVMRAPKRRIDNVVTNLYDSTSMLLLYSKIWNDVVSRYNREWRSSRLMEAGWTTAGGLTFGGTNYLALDAVMQGGVVGTTVLGVGSLFWYHQNYLRGMQEELTTLESLSVSFQRTHPRQIQDADEFSASLWQRIRGSLQTALRNAFDDGASIPSVSQQELDQLQNILDREIPELRRLASNAK
jgi:GTP-binding protein EngB required for normal cell division